METVHNNTDIWNRLYEFMDQIKKMAPWTWMYEDDFFGVEDPETGEMGYISVMGSLGDHFSICAYLGQEGISRFLSIEREEVKPSVEQILETPQLQASFENRDMLNEKDMQIIRKLGRSYRGHMNWPMFRAFHPGHFPWFLNPWEQRFMMHVLEQTIDVTKRFKEDEDLIYPGDDTEYLARVSK